MNFSDSINGTRSMSTKVPGSAGLPLLGDKSYDFYRDPIKFQDKHMNHNKSRVFVSRFLNKPTIFVGSHEVLTEVLHGVLIFGDDFKRNTYIYKCFFLCRPFEEKAKHRDHFIHLSVCLLICHKN